MVNDDQLISRAYEHEWLRKNVLPSLPVRLAGIGAWWDWNKAHPDFGCVKSRDLIAAEVREFILAVPEPELWADYCAYDHVALCQLYGRMIDLPDGIPYFTHELRHALSPVTDPPPMPGAREHNALDDAREVQWRLDWLAGPRDQHEEGRHEHHRTHHADPVRRPGRPAPGGDRRPAHEAPRRGQDVQADPGRR